MKKKYEFEITTNPSFVYGIHYNQTTVTTLTEKIDPDVLLLAFETCMERFPFIDTTLCKSEEGDRYILKTCELPLRLYHQKGEVMFLETPEDPRQIRVSYYEKDIWVNIDHHLTDGMGVLAFVKLLITAYFDIKNKEYAPKKYGEFSEDEYADPYSYLKPIETKYELRSHTSRALEKEAPYEDGEYHIYTHVFPAYGMHELSDIFEGSFTGVLAFVFARALLKVNGGVGDGIVFRTPVTLKSMLGCNQTWRNCHLSIEYCYDDRMIEKPVREQITLLKGMLYAQCNENYLLPKYEKASHIFDDCPDIESKKKVFSNQELEADSIIRYCDYLGEVDFAPYNDLVESHIFYSNTRPNCRGFNMGILEFKDKVYFSLYSNYDCSDLFDAFKKQLDVYVTRNNTIKCMVFDLDGTLLKNDGTVPEEFIDLLYNATEKEVTIAIATARSEKDLLRLFPMQSNNLLMFGREGAVMIKDGKVCSRSFMSLNDVMQIHDMLSGQKDIFTFYAGEDGDYLDQEDMPKLDRWNLRDIANLDTKPFSADKRIMSIHFYCRDGYYAAQEFINNNSQVLDPKYEMVSEGYGWVHVRERNKGKGQIIRQLRDMLSLSRSEIAVFGDSQNDFSMFNEVECSWAMKNAPLDVKKKAAFVTRFGNEQSGAVVEANYILKSKYFAQ